MSNTDNFINRELSWLEFNGRVLEEAEDDNNPLFEKIKFTSIFSSNLDEFFMVRVASLWDQVNAGFNQTDKAGLTPMEQIQKISLRTHELVALQYRCFNERLRPALEKENIFFIKPRNMSQEQNKFIENYYWKNIYPVLTPLIVDQSRPFPLIMNKSLNIVVLLENMEEDKEDMFATVQVPSVLGRFIELPTRSEKRYFVLLEDIIRKYINTIFSGHNVITIGYYRITRNADMTLDEEGAEDLLKTIERSLKMRKWGAVVRLEIEKTLDPRLLKFLKEEMEVPKEGIYSLQGPIDLTFLMKFSSVSGYDHLRYKEIKPQPVSQLKDQDFFQAIDKEDILLHHPYETFEPVVELVQKAAEDPNVLAIKQTLYRVSGNSPIVQALARAAENGKQVTVLLELKARFDEENNIIWARRLEKAGCHVIYGLVGLKTHCKVLLVVRKEEDGIKRYVHMGTGNYNDVTAQLYTDMGLFTSNPYIGSDISALFNMITGYSKLTSIYKVEIAPLGLREEFRSLIAQETEHAQQGKQGRIIAKMNSLVDKETIETLYEASQAGVEIDLLVRGICCLRPGIKGLSENIRVRSIIGRYLEHSRIYYFLNDGNELYYLSSADWMPRNLDHRVELLFPVEERKNRRRLKKVLNVYLKDNMKARLLTKDGSYRRIEKNESIELNCQEYFAEMAVARASRNKETTPDEFVPKMSPD